MHKRINMCTYILYFKYIGQMNDKKKNTHKSCNCKVIEYVMAISVECGDNGDV